MFPCSQLFLQILCDSVWCHGDFMVFQVGIDNFAVCAKQLGWMWSGWWDPWMWRFLDRKNIVIAFRYYNLHCEQWVHSGTVIVSMKSLMCWDYKWFLASKNPTDPGTRIGPLSLGSLPLGDAREATVKELELLDAWWQCTVDGSRTADVVQFYESAWWCWIGALTAMTRKVRSFALIVTDLSAASPHLRWWTASWKSARIWSLFPSDKFRNAAKSIQKDTSKNAKNRGSWPFAISKQMAKKLTVMEKTWIKMVLTSLVPCSCMIFQQPQHSLTFWYFPNSMNLGTPFFQLSSKPIQTTRLEGLCAGDGFWAFAHQWQLWRHCL